MTLELDGPEEQTLEPASGWPRGAGVSRMPSATQPRSLHSAPVASDIIGVVVRIAVRLIFSVGIACSSDRTRIESLHEPIQQLPPSVTLDAQRYIGLEPNVAYTFRTEGGLMFRRTVTRLETAEAPAESVTRLRHQRIESLRPDGNPVLESEYTYDLDTPEGPCGVEFHDPSGRTPPEVASQRLLVLPATIRQDYNWKAGFRTNAIIGRSIVHADIGEQRDCIVVESRPSARLRAFYCEGIGLTLALEERAGRWHLEQILAKREAVPADSGAYGAPGGALDRR